MCRQYTGCPGSIQGVQEINRVSRQYTGCPGNEQGVQEIYSVFSKYTDCPVNICTGHLEIYRVSRRYTERLLELYRMSRKYTGCPDLQVHQNYKLFLGNHNADIFLVYLVQCDAIRWEKLFCGDVSLTALTWYTVKN